MNDKFERDEFHSKLPKSWNVPNKALTSLIEVNKEKKNKNEISIKKEKLKNKRPFNYDALVHKLISLAFFSFNIFFILLCTYIVLQIFLAIRNDIRIRVDEEFSKLQYLIQESNYKYLINKCGLVDIPAMKRDCMEWKKNMEKTRGDIQVMGIIMDCLGHIVDRFLEQISWKFFITLFSSFAVYFIFYRKSTS